MSREKQIKIYSLAIALTIAIVCTIMIFGIQLNFNQKEVGAKITAPILVVGLIAILIIFKFIKKQSKTNFVLKHAELKANTGKKSFSPYFTICFTYFDYMLYLGILSLLCGIVTGILNSIYKTILFVKISDWAYTLSRMAIVFAIYVLCLVIYTIGSMIAFSQREQIEKKDDKE